MRCITCENISLSIICKNCQNNFLNISLQKRELEKDFFVYSFYKYEEIKEFLNTKYEFYGDRVYNILAKHSFEKFASNFTFEEKVVAISVDDDTSHQFSQSAILVNNLKSKIIIPKYSTLKATNKVKYAGKSLEFRKTNKRKFIYNGKSDLKVILVDDIVTTGLTLLEAKEILEKNGCEVLFALTLSDARL